MNHETSQSRADIIADLLATYRQTTKVFMEAFQSVIQESTDCNAGAIFLLKIVRDCNGSSQHEIAVRMNVSDAAISRQVAICLEKRYIQSCVDTTNRRRAVVTLTKEGERILEVVDTAVSRYVASRLQEVSDENIRQIINDNKLLQERIQL